jgi:hypothetical protein
VSPQLEELWKESMVHSASTSPAMVVVVLQVWLAVLQMQLMR